MTLTASYYQQFDADAALEVPAEGYGGWKRADIAISREHTGLVVMHAWDTGSAGQFPGWRRAVEYLDRADRICREVFPELLDAARAANLPVFHVAGGGEYHQDFPGYHRAVELTGPPRAEPEQIATDPVLESLRAWKQEHSFVGPHNRPDVDEAFGRIGFAPEALPQDSEGVAANADQLFALCRASGVNHLVYAGFALNWCLLMSPGGMVDMSRRGFMCSALRQAVTAVENKETARGELNKEAALWRVALGFGFVFDVPDFITALQSHV